MIKYSRQYPAIFDLLCGYFNLDWECDYESPEEVISAFARDGDKKDLKKAIQELKTKLQEQHTKEEWLHIIYNDFGCFCNPEYNGMHPQKWLEQVLKQLEEELTLMKED